MVNAIIQTKDGPLTNWSKHKTKGAESGCEREDEQAAAEQGRGICTGTIENERTRVKRSRRSVEKRGKDEKRKGANQRLFCKLKDVCTTMDFDATHTAVEARDMGDWRVVFSMGSNADAEKERTEWEAQSKTVQHTEYTRIFGCSFYLAFGVLKLT